MPHHLKVTLQQDAVILLLWPRYATSAKVTRQQDAVIFLIGQINQSNDIISLLGLIN